MRKTMALFLALSGLLTAGGALAENQYYTVNTPVFDRAEYGVFGSD